MFKVSSVEPTYDHLVRMAKKKLPTEVKKKIEEWKFSSGALVMCLVAYSDGRDVQSFQSVNCLSDILTYIPDSKVPVLRVPQSVEIPSPILVVSGRMGLMKTLRNGL